MFPTPFPSADFNQLIINNYLNMLKNPHLLQCKSLSFNAPSSLVVQLLQQQRQGKENSKPEDLSLPVTVKEFSSPRKRRSTAELATSSTPTRATRNESSFEAGASSSFNSSSSFSIPNLLSDESIASSYSASPCLSSEITTSSRKFNCTQCDKVYFSVSALKMHIRTHTLPCKCEICGKAFSRMWLLNGHIRTHTGEKPFACNVCHRAFADRSNLRAHMQTHSEVKKYRCQLCGKTFSRMGLLAKHRRSGCTLSSSPSSS
ncbi:hypothetical protein Ciccas_006437 [Cichlidogyrus casuarinus]|uniref:C2H2-type domain-containing protein n=1 Tax=Cichlidogyrus casuarinus TaxID=1844966 RepID=A0ABD2Q5T2_9PLAT